MASEGAQDGAGFEGLEATLSRGSRRLEWGGARSLRVVVLVFDGLLLADSYPELVLAQTYRIQSWGSVCLLNLIRLGHYQPFSVIFDKSIHPHYFGSITA